MILLSHFFTNDKFNRYKFLGTVIGFISIFILFYDQVYILFFKTTTIISVLIVMSASLSYVIGGLIIQKYREHNNDYHSNIINDMWNINFITDNLHLKIK